MRMSGGLLSSVVAVLTAAAAALGTASSGGASGGGSSAGAGPSGACPPAGARVIARDSVARVFQLGGAAGPRLGGVPVYACQLRSGRRFALGGGAQTRVTRVSLAGAVVAYATTLMGVDTSQSTVTVLNLAGGSRHTVASASPTRRPESFTSVSALVATPRGSAAWVASSSAIGQPQPTYEVRRLQGGADTLLDSGPAISPGSLRRSGATVTWTDAGRRRAAPLR